MLKELMDNKYVFNIFGWTFNTVGFGSVITEWITNINMTNALTLTTLILGVVWWVMKLYDQYLITNKRKNELDH